ncbi:hypothetical protein DMH04_01955 [Kibdelosporangium aridum]|uniref:Uncharacterized protein n=1 Tax=Kibdelosporangium aridum TaxID=2030 RepID=A0A428ZUJ6_KIBAR|nr:hypothetical protein [Kibdelosporangium aridum]RSM91759.1 hypothetical protein DMH04_01955 [Kibdelosporangium aridum]
MNDILDVHEERELPESVRADARRRIVADIHRPNRTGGWAPLAIASAVVLLAAGAVTFTVTTSRSQELPPATAESQNRFVTPEEMYSVKDLQAPPEQAARCAAAGADWRPLMTASARGVTVITYSTDAGPRFCELTPSTVTLSAPVDATSTAGTARATFVSASGTVAGVLDPAFRAMQVGPGGRQPGRTLAVVRAGVFVAPNNLPPGAQGLTIALGGTPQIMGGERSVPATEVPSVTPAVVDRPQPPRGSESDGARRLADCFARPSAYRAVDPANWEATESLPLTKEETLQLGRYGNLLAVCVISADQVSLKIDEEAPGNGYRDLEVPSNPYLFSTTVFYDFRERPGGSGESDTVVVAGLVKSPDVASVSISRPESPAVRADVHNGTFALPNIWLNEGTLEQRHKSEITVLDAKDTVLARLPIRI